MLCTQPRRYLSSYMAVLRSSSPCCPLPHEHAMCCSQLPCSAAPGCRGTGPPSGVLTSRQFWAEVHIGAALPPITPTSQPLWVPTWRTGFYHQVSDANSPPSVLGAPTGVLNVRKTAEGAEAASPMSLAQGPFIRGAGGCSTASERPCHPQRSQPCPWAPVPNWPGAWGTCRWASEGGPQTRPHSWKCPARICPEALVSVCFGCQNKILPEAGV